MATKKVVLAFDIWHDIQRYFLVYVLLLMVVLSAFSVIYLTHLNRQTTVKLENLLSERDELDVEWRNLLLEQNSLAEHSAIESKAINRLQMKHPSVGSEVVVKIK